MALGMHASDRVAAISESLFGDISYRRDQTLCGFGLIIG
jgi:hypothetical protein